MITRLSHNTPAPGEASRHSTPSESITDAGPHAYPTTSNTSAAMQRSGSGFPTAAPPGTSPVLRSQMEFYMTGVSPVDCTSLAAIPTEDCTICLELLTEDVIRLHACNHMFHTLCIIGWFDDSAPRSGRRRGTCPNCRCELYEPDNPPRTVPRAEPESNGIPNFGIVSILDVEEEQYGGGEYSSDEEEEEDGDDQDGNGYHYDYDSDDDGHGHGHEDLYILDNYEYLDDREGDRADLPLTAGVLARHAALEQESGDTAAGPSAFNLTDAALHRQPGTHQRPSDALAERRMPWMGRSWVAPPSYERPQLRSASMSRRSPGPPEGHDQRRRRPRFRSASTSRSPGPEGHETELPLHSRTSPSHVRSRYGPSPLYGHSTTSDSLNHPTPGQLATRSIPTDRNRTIVTARTPTSRPSDHSITPWSAAEAAAEAEPDPYSNLWTFERGNYSLRQQHQQQTAHASTAAASGQPNSSHWDRDRTHDGPASNALDDDIRLIRERFARVAAIPPYRAPQGPPVRHTRPDPDDTSSQDQAGSMVVGSGGTASASIASASATTGSAGIPSPPGRVISRRAMRQGLRRLSEDFRMRQLRFQRSETDATVDYSAGNRGG